MTDKERIETAVKIGFFEMNPKADICKDCPNCELEVKTLEHCYLGKHNTKQVIGECSHADACRIVFEHCERKAGME